MDYERARRRKLIIIVVVAIAALGIIALLIGLALQPKNPYGQSIVIQNYPSKVKNLPTEMRFATESSLYTTVKKNVDQSVKVERISDALIRDNSDKQDFNKATNVYNGSYLVDMDSIKQTYYIQYSYSSDDVNRNALPDRIIITCATKEQSKYGDFACTDQVKAQAAPDDSLMQYLPFKSFSFKLTAVQPAKADSLFIAAELNIPESDFGKTTATKRTAVASYKAKVVSWFTTRKLDPSKYKIVYNYTDDGTPVDPFVVTGQGASD